MLGKSLHLNILHDSQMNEVENFRAIAWYHFLDQLGYSALSPLTSGKLTSHLD